MILHAIGCFITLCFYIWLACTEFCERWAHSLLESFAVSTANDEDVNPYNLKSISENYKLKVVIIYILNYIIVLFYILLSYLYFCNLVWWIDNSVTTKIIIIIIIIFIVIVIIIDGPGPTDGARQVEGG